LRKIAITGEILAGKFLACVKHIADKELRGSTSVVVLDLESCDPSTLISNYRGEN
jgi:hypothetical protein